MSLGHLPWVQDGGAACGGRDAGISRRSATRTHESPLRRGPCYTAAMSENPAQDQNPSSLIKELEALKGLFDGVRAEITDRTNVQIEETLESCCAKAGKIIFSAIQAERLPLPKLPDPLKNSHSYQGVGPWEGENDPVVYDDSRYGAWWLAFLGWLNEAVELPTMLGSARATKFYIAWAVQIRISDRRDIDIIAEEAEPISPLVFHDSEAAITYLLELVGGGGQTETATTPISSEPEPPRGRPVEYPPEVDERLASDWQIARVHGTRKADFAKEKGISEKKLDKALGRDRKRRKRDSEKSDP